MEFDREWIEKQIENNRPTSMMSAYELGTMIARRDVLVEVLKHHTEKKKVDLSKLPVQYYLDDAGGEKRIANVYNWPENFIYWPGGECPVPDGLEFEYIVRAGVTHSNELRLASSHGWNHICVGGDIIAYRLTGGVMEGWEL